MIPWCEVNTTPSNKQQRVLIKEMGVVKKKFQILNFACKYLGMGEKQFKIKTN